MPKKTNHRFPHRLAEREDRTLFEYEKTGLEHLVNSLDRDSLDKWGKREYL